MLVHPDGGPVLVDRRSGSIELKTTLESYGLPTEAQEMPYGDFAFSGRGASGPCMIGIERKRLHDALSVIENGRFSAYQLPGLLSTYDHVFLIVEGLWRSNPESGYLEMRMGGATWKPVFRGRTPYHYRVLDSWLTTLQLKTSVMVRTTSGAPHTAALISNLYDWFNGKDWEDHHSYRSLHIEQTKVSQIEPPSLPRRVAKEFHRIGWERSLAVEQRFGSVYRMVNAGVQDWLSASIQGVGPQTAARIVREIRGGEPE